MSTRVLHLHSNFAAAIIDAARSNFPVECCGLIEGVDAPDGWTATAVRETVNVADEPTRRFLIHPQAQFDMLRRLRGSEKRIIGCFHSHPGGQPEPSAADRAAALDPDFVWLIAGGAPEAGFVLKAYVFSARCFSPIALRGDEARETL